MNRVPSPLYLITDRHQTGGRPLLDVVSAALVGGVRVVQLREKDLGGADLLALARELREITSHHDTLLLINDRIDVALAAGADGVHLGRAGIPVAAARRLLGPEPLIGYSAHAVAEALQAQADGADYVTFGPVFATPSKTAYGDPVGVALLAEAVGALRIPVFALGGINAATIPTAAQAGPAGFALISAIIAAPDPAAAARQLLTIIEDHASQP